MKWRHRLILNRISKIAITLSLALSVTLAGFTFYGDKVGNFVVSLDQTTAALALSTAESPTDEKAWQSRLSMQGLKRQTDATFADLPDDVDVGMGTKNDPRGRYMAFSFWLINCSTGAVDYEIAMQLTDLRGDAINAMRILFIEGDRLGGKQPGKIYAAEETDDPEIFLPEYEQEMTKPPDERLIHSKEEKLAQLAVNTNYDTVPFVGGEQLVRETRTGFEKNASIKYTVVVWLEGWDYDCADDILGSSLKMKLDFNVTG